jgi:hypothetical protein
VYNPGLSFLPTNMQWTAINMGGSRRRHTTPLSIHNVGIGQVAIEMALRPTEGA